MSKSYSRFPEIFIKMCPKTRFLHLFDMKNCVLPGKILDYVIILDALLHLLGSASQFEQFFFYSTRWRSLRENQ